MRRWSRLAASIAALTGIFATPALAGAAPNYDQIHAGRYQAILGDCMGCHTAPGGRLFAGGAALQTPFGAMVAPNITPDVQTGIGAWSEADFRRALKQGIGRGGKRLYPAMPFPSYARMSDADVANLWAYLQTVAPVRRAVRSNLLSFPFNIRTLMVAWDWLFFRGAEFQPDPHKSAQWNRGAYIVTGPGHCGACHTPKTFLGSDDSAVLTGASLAGWFAPDITANARRGVGSWSGADLVSYLKTGRNRHSMASGPMAEAIEDSTALMDDADLAAVAAYLKNAPASPNGSAVLLAANDPRMRSGQALYRDNCEACHNHDGSGQSVIFPPLAGNPIVLQASAQTLARVVLAGTQAAQTKFAPTAPAMPSFAWRLGDAQIADLLTYVRGSWGNSAAPVSSGAVASIRKDMRH